MKYTILKYGMLAGALLFGGCSNWLDVDPKSQVKQEALFESEAGFQDALTGIYTMMARTGMYGGHETMGFLVQKQQLKMQNLNLVMIKINGQQLMKPVTLQAVLMTKHLQLY